jgi:uncharacterized membrane protein YqhA
MRQTFGSIRIVIRVIAWLVFFSGVILTIIGAFNFIMVFYHVGSGAVNATNARGIIAIELLHAVDVFLVAIVFFVLALGILILFNKPENQLSINLPEWLRVKNFMDLKAILWEAILTTLVVSYLASLAEKEIAGQEITMQSLVIPGGIFLISLSLYFLKRGEK